MARGYGYADLETRTLVSPDSLFRIASISKPITAMAVMKLIEEKSWSSTSQSHRFSIGIRSPTLLRNTWILDGVKSPFDNSCNTEAVGIAKLLLIPCFKREDSPKSMASPYRFVADDFIAAMRHHKLDFDPGSKYAYSNFGYNLLGRVIEARSGMPYETYVRERLLLPLGLTRMQIGHTRKEDRLPEEVILLRCGQSQIYLSHR